VISRASRPLHIKILKTIGIDEIVNPGIDAAEKLVYGLMHRNLLDLVHIDENTSVAKIQAPDEFVGKSIGQLNLRARYGVNVIAISTVRKTNGNQEETVRSNPGADVVIKRNDILVVIGHPDELEKLTKK
jgi:trk system potassium uptake protein TrkA